MYLVALLLSILTAALNAVQAGTNAQLNKSLGNPLLATLVVSLTGLTVIIIAIVVCALLPIEYRPLRAPFESVPWWGWFGGVLGLLYVFAMTLFANRLGSGVFSAVTLASTIVTAVLLDHFALVGFKEHPLTSWRALGCALMIGGATLIARF